jgi:polyisoprenyl-teichoic acid--peptidoglycan teichoic acid transferase
LFFLKKFKPGFVNLQLIIFIATSTLIVVGAALVSLHDYYNPEKVFSEFAGLRGDGEIESYNTNIFKDGKQEGQADYRLPLRINLVFLGLDQTEQVEYFNRQTVTGVARTDAIIFATVDIREREVKAITIPRDAKVPIINRGINDKINSAFKYGMQHAENDDSLNSTEEGLRYTLETIENLMGAPVDFYVTIDIDDLIKIVDLMGGVYYDVEKDIRADLGQGRVLIEEGYQHLDGEHFFYYVHYRDVYGGHDDRMDRHRRILQSTFEQFRKTGNLAKIPFVFNILKDSINTNLENRHVGALVRFAGELDMEKIKFYKFEGEGMFTEYGYYFYINEAHRAEVLAEMLGVEVEEMGVPIGVPYVPEEDDEPEYQLNLFEDWDKSGFDEMLEISP